MSPEAAMVDDDFLDPEMLDTTPGMLHFDVVGLERQIADLQREITNKDRLIDKAVENAERKLRIEAHDAKTRASRLEKEVERLEDELEETKSFNQVRLDTIAKELSGGSQRLYAQAVTAEIRWLRAYDIIRFLLEQMSHSGFVNGCPDPVKANISMSARKMMECPPIPMFNDPPDDKFKPWQRLMKLFSITSNGHIGGGTLPEDKE